MVVSGHVHALSALLPVKNPDTHWAGGWVGSTRHSGRREKEKNVFLYWHFIPGSSCRQPCQYKSYAIQAPFIYKYSKYYIYLNFKDSDDSV